MAKHKVHYADIRLHNNAGINMPVCYAGAERLDLDKTGLSTGDFREVTCKHCIRVAPKRYPWAGFQRRFPEKFSTLAR